MPLPFKVVLANREDGASGRLGGDARGESERVLVVEAGRGAGGYKAFVNGPIGLRAVSRGRFERPHACAARGDSRVEIIQLPLLFRERGVHVGRLVAEVVDEAAVGRLIEEREELVKLLLRKGIVLVVVAARAS